MKKLVATILIVIYILVFILICFGMTGILLYLSIQFDLEHFENVLVIMGILLYASIGFPIMVSDINAVYSKCWRRYDR